MGVDLVKNQNIAQYISILSNPDFLNAVKTATKGDKSDSLLKNLDKLKNILSESSSDSSVIETSSGESLSLLKSITSSVNTSPSNGAETAGYAGAASAEQDIQSIIANIELLEATMNLEMEGSNEDIADLFKKFREIISKLDQESRKLHEDVKNKEIKTELKLTPSSNTKSGFQEGLTLVAK